MLLLVLPMALAIAAEPIAVGFGFGVGSQPAGGLPALTADLFALEVQVPLAARRTLDVQVDWAQLALDAVLTSRRRIGVTALHRWSQPVRPRLDLGLATGFDTELGTEAIAVDGALAHRPSVAIGLSSRIGLSVPRDGRRFHPGVFARGTLGVEPSAAGSALFARALVETTLTWSAK